ncbi:IDEAL domain-containing protein [Sutcliffiella halmapala]|uniref:IDEAL domain-containing protein n=1 Tax=Sutcliffiella halmapala TaxID=79882 RepID=UPI0009953481|nr:IDEAL domain-containing protein [Sutcliffiella halmapala]
MLPKNKTVLKSGDWIKGKTSEGELVIGYIESFMFEEVVKVKVVTCDNNDTVGKTVNLLKKQVNRLPVSNVTNKAQILFLIDLALATGDEEWFVELSSKLNAIKELVKELH